MALSSAEIARLQARLELYYAAESACLRNQSYKMPDGRELSRANLNSIQGEIRALRRELEGATDTPVTRGRVRRGVPMSG